MNNNYFETSDLSLASALLFFGFKLESLERSNPKASFIFQRTEYLDETIQGFWAGELKVEPKAFFNCIKEIKSRLYQG